MPHRWSALWNITAALTLTLGYLQPALAKPQFSLTTVPALSQSVPKSRFYDLRNSQNRACIEVLAERKIINGFPDGSFRPHFPVTRAQFAVMVSRAFPQARPVRSRYRFADVSPYDWSANAVQAAYQGGFLSGFPNRNFQPNWGITRAQVLVALANGLNYTPSGAAVVGLRTTFRDAHTIPRYARSAIAAANERQLLASGSSSQLLRPNHLARRAEVAMFLCQALQEPQRAVRL